MSISTPAERLEPVLTWIEGQRDAALADLQRFCRIKLIAVLLAEFAVSGDGV